MITSKNEVTGHQRPRPLTFNALHQKTLYSIETKKKLAPKPLACAAYCFLVATFFFVVVFFLGEVLGLVAGLALGAVTFFLGAVVFFLGAGLSLAAGFSFLAVVWERNRAADCEVQIQCCIHSS
jgi:lipopolysaccharide export LptBFGC system permease protein LptF